MKATRGIFAGVFISLSLVLAGCGDGGGTANTPTPSGGSTPAASNDGRAVFAVSDAAADMGAVTSVKVTIDSVKVHQEGGAWVTVATQPQTYDLLELRAKAASQLLADAKLAAGTYDQLDLMVSKAVVVDAKGAHEAKLPSSKLQFKTLLEVKANATAAADLDFQADESLHVTGNGEYIIAPVIEVETRSNTTVQVQSNNIVTVTGGSTTAESRVGMDINGNVGAGLMITPGAVLSISSGKVIQTKGEVVLAGTIKAVDAVKGTVTITTSTGTEVVVNATNSATIDLGAGAKTLAELSGKVGSETVVKYDAESRALMNLSGSGSASGSAGGSSGGSAGMGGKASLSGTIKSVDAAAGTVTVTTEAGKDVVLKVASDAALKVEGSATTMTQLASSVGSQVNVEYDAQTSVASSVSAGAKGSVSGSATIQGALKSIDLLAGTITIASSSGDIVLKVAADTKLLVNGAQVTLASFAQKVNSQVNASYKAETQTATTVDVKS